MINVPSFPQTASGSAPFVTVLLSRSSVPPSVVTLAETTAPKISAFEAVWTESPADPLSVTPSMTTVAPSSTMIALDPLPFVRTTVV